MPIGSAFDDSNNAITLSQESVMTEEEKLELGPLQLIWYWLCEGIKAGLRAVGWAVVVLLAFGVSVFMVYYVTNNACIQPVNPGDPLVCVFTDTNLWFTPK